jgi:hypothetical protein
MAQEIIIRSFFTSESNLADEMRDWKEFISGDGYSIELEDRVTGEKITVREESDWEDRYIVIESLSENELFDRVIGRVICSMSKHSGYLKIKTTREK